jgi:hypothetical protein
VFLTKRPNENKILSGSIMNILSFFLFSPIGVKVSISPFRFTTWSVCVQHAEQPLRRRKKNWGKENIGPQVEPTLFLSLFLDCQKPFFVSTTSSVSPYVVTQIIYSKAISVTLNDFLCFLDKWT